MLKAIKIGLCLALFVSSASAFEIDEGIKSDRDAVARVQEQLSELGYSLGSADGVFGRKLQGAIESFHSDLNSTAEPGLTPAMVDLISRAHDSWFAEPAFQSQQLFSPSTSLFEVDVTDLDPACDVPDCTINMFFLAADDLTGDGAPELVFSTMQSDDEYRDRDTPSPLVILINDGAGAFSYYRPDEPTSASRRVHGREAAVADFNGDGINDIFVAAHGLDRKPFPGEPTLLMLSGPAGLADASDTNLEPLSAMNHGVAAEDVDGDGDPDLLVITNAGASTIDPYFLINDGEGGFKRSNEPDRLTDSLRIFLTGRVDRSKSATVRFIDVNGDTAKDLIFAISGDDGDRADRYSGFKRTRVVVNDGQNRWLRENAFELPVRRWGYWTLTSDVDGGDVDGDGDVDLLITEGHRTDSGWRGQHHQLLLNDGAGRFEDVTPTNLWSQGYPDHERLAFPINSFLVDLDNDDDLDMVVQTLDPAWRDDRAEPIKRALVGLNDGTGRFQPIDPESFAPAFDGRQLRPADIDQDGDVDLIGLKLRGKVIDDELYTGGFSVQFFENTTVE